jgi:hypothetical protein
MKSKKLFVEWENIDKIPMFEINLRDYIDTLEEDEYIYTYITGDIKGLYCDSCKVIWDDNFSLDEHLQELFEMWVNKALEGMK